MTSIYQISENKYAVEWPIVTVNFVDGGQLKMRDNGEAINSMLIGNRKVRSIDAGAITKTGSLEDCHKQA